MELVGKVVVVTGASSGIGRATALELARRGAALVLAARDPGPLEEAAAACRALGVQAIPVPTDVTDEQAVEALAARAEGELGCIDAWVNNAGVYVLGRFEDVPSHEFRRVLEVNVMGYVHGARAALRRFRALGRGVLVNVASVDATVGPALASAYVTSKFAVRGFAESLRQELRGSGIEVVTILPPSIDTPLFQHSANYTGHVIQPVPPVYPAQRVAEAIARAIEHPQREVSIGAAGKMLRFARAIAPATAQRLFSRKVERQHLSEETAPDTDGNLNRPMGPAAVAPAREPRSRRAAKAAGFGFLALLPAAAVLAWNRRR